MKILVGDILKSQMQTLVNTVNCVGIMGKGIAEEFKKRFPEMYEDYANRCKQNKVTIGQPYIYKNLFGQQIVNFPTKEHWKSLSKVKDIQEGLEFLLANYRKWGVTSIAIPPLGCGNGQLDWKIVGPIIYKYARQMNIPVELYAPYGARPAELKESFLENADVIKDYEYQDSRNSKGAFNPAWIGLIEILHKIEKQPYHIPVGRTIFQKIAYVATMQGLPTGFAYQKSSYGPFSKDLKPTESKLINNNLLQEEHLGRMFEIRVGPGFETARKRYKSFLENYFPIIEKTADLFMRVDTTQAESLATVLFAASELKKTEKSISEMDVFKAVMDWKQRRRPPLDKTLIASTIRNLGMLNWLDVKPDETLPVSQDSEIFV